jgi:hypothetical protein
MKTMHATHIGDTGTRPSLSARVGLNLAAIVGQIALAGFLVFLMLAKAVRRGRMKLREHKKHLILFGAGALVGAIGTAILTLSLLLDQSPADAALTLAVLVLDRPMFFRVM